MVDPERLSRFLSFLLRHKPDSYSLTIDERGFMSLEQLAETVQDRFPGLTQEEVLSVVEKSDKKRFEFQNGKVRATYGHSFSVDLGHEAVEPPRFLYHGTARDLAQSILKEGLRPSGRQYVHLSLSVEDALAVGKRRDPFPAVLKVKSGEAHAQGRSFYRSGPLFLTEEVPSLFLSLVDRD